MRKEFGWVLGLVLVMWSSGASAAWWNLTRDDFSTAPTNWTYEGVLNAAGQPMFRYDAANARIAAEWDQSNFIETSSDPYIISNSFLVRALPRVLTDANTFRVRATLRFVAGSIPDTTEFYQIANIGLYNLEQTGPDRTLADDWSGNVTLLRDASDFVEFSYFINNKSYGMNPNITAVIGGRVPDDTDHAYYTGNGADPWYHLTDMGEDNYLPVETDIFVELVYFGGATGDLSRRANATLYSDAERTTVLEVNGVPMSYWTEALPPAELFEVTHVGFFNYAAENWGGANAQGAGSWDDVSVDLALEEGTILSSGNPAALAMTWVAEPGASYAVVSLDDLLSGARTTQAVVVATDTLAGWTNASSSARGFFFVEPLE